MAANASETASAPRVPEKVPSTQSALVNKASETNFGEVGEVTNYLQGWEFHFITITLMFAVFLPQVEGTIAATALVYITNDLQGFNESSWVITAYMLTYTGFLIISAKFSDIFGRKLLLLASITLFVTFPAACAGAQTMTQLIILRAFQGIGASGTYSLVTVIFFELVPPEKYAPYTSILSGVLGFSVVVAHVLGAL